MQLLRNQLLISFIMQIQLTEKYFFWLERRKYVQSRKNGWL